MESIAVDKFVKFSWSADIYVKKYVTHLESVLNHVSTSLKMDAAKNVANKETSANISARLSAIQTKSVQKLSVMQRFVFSVSAVIGGCKSYASQFLTVLPLSVTLDVGRNKEMKKLQMHLVVKVLSNKTKIRLSLSTTLKKRLLSLKRTSNGVKKWRLT